MKSRSLAQQPLPWLALNGFSGYFTVDRSIQLDPIVGGQAYMALHILIETWLP